MQVKQAGIVEALSEARINERVQDKYTDRTIDDIVKGLQEWRRPCVPMLGDDVAGPTDLYNAAGAIYPKVDAKQQGALLAAAICAMDRIRYDMVQENHTNFIAEPLFLADIAHTRSHYWPGLDEAKRYIAEHKTFKSFEQKHIKDGLLTTPYSDFCIAYGIMRSDFCDWGSKMAKALRPSFVDRVIEGAVRLRSGADQVYAHGRLKLLLPKEAHARLAQNYER